jgi:N-acetylmuramoyl-L-alanine amidase CwlA
MIKCDKPKTNISSKIHMIYISSNNVRHSVHIMLDDEGCVHTLWEVEWAT